MLLSKLLFDCIKFKRFILIVLTVSKHFFYYLRFVVNLRRLDFALNFIWMCCVSYILLFSKFTLFEIL